MTIEYSSFLSRCATSDDQILIHFPEIEPTHLSAPANVLFDCNNATAAASFSRNHGQGLDRVFNLSLLLPE